MSINAYLRIEEIPGGCRKTGRENCIELLSFTWGVHCTAGTHDGTIDVVGESIPSEFVIEKTIDTTSPRIAKSCSEGQRLGQVTVELWRAERPEKKWMEYTMSPARITSVQAVGARDAKANPIEKLTFAYNKMKWDYVSTGGDSEGGTTEEHDWTTG